MNQAHISRNDSEGAFLKSKMTFWCKHMCFHFDEEFRHEFWLKLVYWQGKDHLWANPRTFVRTICSWWTMLWHDEDLMMTNRKLPGSYRQIWWGSTQFAMEWVAIGSTTSCMKIMQSDWSLVRVPQWSYDTTLRIRWLDNGLLYETNELWLF